MNGSCDLTVGECECDDGYVGGICDSGESIHWRQRIILHAYCMFAVAHKVCPSGTFGAECAELCTCVAGRVSSPCDSVNGACHCLPGFTGQDCEESNPFFPMSEYAQSGRVSSKGGSAGEASPPKCLTSPPPPPPNY